MVPGRLRCTPPRASHAQRVRVRFGGVACSCQEALPVGQAIAISAGALSKLRQSPAEACSQRMR
eukprot:10704872-Alexandrium_andersonii.AAC.1